MTKLEELIEKLCPNGVEYKILGDISCKISDGMHNLPKNIKSSGEYPILSAQNITNGNINIDTSKWVNHEIFERENKRNNVEKGDVLLTIVGAIGRTAVVKDNLKVLFQRSVCVIKPNVKLLNSKFLYYALNSTVVQSYIQNNAKGAAQKGLYLKQVAKIKLPVPPLEVQREIVRILDNFTELTAELTARKKQYEYYRDRLLHFTCNTKKYVLGDIATVTKLAGFEFTKYVKYSNEGQIIALRGLNIKNGKLQLGDVKYIDHSDLTKLSRSKLHIGDMLFTYVGTIGQVALIDEEDKYYLAPNVALIRCDKRVLLPEYMRYYFQSNLFWDKQINRLLQSSSMKNIPMEKIRKFEIVAPSLEVQKRFVDVLDHFDAICSDLKIGLPAEIEARKKQYEYYRDQLLTFAESGRMLVDRQTDRQTDRHIRM